MSRLIPGATYIYERDGDTVYARLQGSTDRFVIGILNSNKPSYHSDPLDHRNYMSDPTQSQLWHDIRLAATADAELQEALDRVKILYYLKHSIQKKAETLDW